MGGKGGLWRERPQAQGSVTVLSPQAPPSSGVGSGISMDDLFSEVVIALNGENQNVPLSKVLEDPKIAQFFMNMVKPKWHPETLMVFFQSRPEYEVDTDAASVRIKSDITVQIQRVNREKRRTATVPMKVYKVILQAGSLAETVSAVTQTSETHLGALPTDVVKALLETFNKSAETPDPMLQLASAKILTAVPGSLIKDGASLGVLMDFYKTVLALQGDQAPPSVAAQRLKTLRELCDLAGAMLDKGVGAVSPNVIGLLCQTAPLHIMSLAVAALGEQGDGEDVKKVAGLFGQVPASKLEGLPRDTMLRLAIAATKSTAVAEAVVGTVAAASAATISVWTLDDVSKLLLVLAKAKAGADSPQVASLYGRGAEALFSKLSEMPDVQFIKIALVFSKVASCKEFLEAVAAEAVNRLATIAPAALLLLTQGLASLGGENASFVKVLDFWAAPPDESNSQLSADQLAKLMQSCTSAPNHGCFWEKVGSRLVAQSASLTDAGKLSVGAAFPDGNGPGFPEKDKLLAAVKPKGGEKRRRQR
jgi:hypothetical protein